jgi:hypothetical protein
MVMEEAPSVIARLVEYLTGRFPQASGDICQCLHEAIAALPYSRGYKKRAISDKLCHTLHERQSYFE